MPDKTSVVVGDQVLYTVKVKNDGPSGVENATFTFSLPSGFNHQNVVFQGNGCGSQGAVIIYNSQTGKYTSKLNLPSGCEITYIFTAGVTATTSGTNQQAEATILRPNDVTDPDATNTSLNIPPADPHFFSA
ncbi:conserved repeat domain-containing protein [Chryseobacterium wanjuense]|uniref:Conserved repeat domain-containing protein n=1 Tax=Chryseobacterium wanjuense TaxID=356305 RepID=A0A1I0NKK4_9FLAO|nr:conserved repeat domain-containing protein [Chryseobacterium wanjuense]